MGVPLLYVDAVSSIGGAPVLPDEWHIDLCLGGAQKCLSALPDTCFLSVSARAWEIVDRVNYVGYDAIKPFKTAVEKHYFPYTPGWQATAGLNAGAEAILQEGLEACFKRHADVAAYCRKRLVEIGYTLFPAPGAVPLPPSRPSTCPRGLPGASSTSDCAGTAWWWAAATGRSPARSSAWATWAPRPTWGW